MCRMGETPSCRSQKTLSSRQSGHDIYKTHIFIFDISICYFHHCSLVLEQRCRQELFSGEAGYRGRKMYLKESKNGEPTFAGKVALIRGASHGMGQAIAELFVEAGVAVVMTARAGKAGCRRNRHQGQRSQGPGITADAGSQACTTYDAVPRAAASRERTLARLSAGNRLIAGMHFPMIGKVRAASTGAYVIVPE